MNEDYDGDSNTLDNHQEKIAKVKAQMNVYADHKRIMNELIEKGKRNGKNRKKKNKTTRKD